MAKQPYGYKAPDSFFSYHHSFEISNQEIPVHAHNYYELLFFLQGESTFYIEGQAYNTRANDLMIINRGELHCPIHHSSKVYERIMLKFDRDYLTGFETSTCNLLRIFEDRKAGQWNLIDGQTVTSNNILHYFKQMDHYILENHPTTPVLVKTLFIQLLVQLNHIYLNRRTDLGSRLKNDMKIQSILKYINDHLHEKITLDGLSEVFFLSKYYLCHIFKESTGCSIFEYITHKRIAKAKELLEEGIPPTEVSRLVGFAEYSSFYKSFKKIAGLAPGQFTKNHSLSLERE